MKAPRFLLLLAPLLLLGLTSCPETTVPRDFGGKPLTLIGTDWEGTWQKAGTSDKLRFEVKDAAKGQLTVFVIDQEKKTEEAIEVLVHGTGAQDREDLVFLTGISKEDSAWGSLNLASVPQDGVFHLWNPQHAEVEAAVKGGELAGKLKPVKEKDDDKPHNHTQLSADPTNYPKVMEAKFWDWTKPDSYVRMPTK